MTRNKIKQNKIREKGFRIQAVVWKNFKGLVQILGTVGREILKRKNLTLKELLFKVPLGPPHEAVIMREDELMSMQEN